MTWYADLGHGCMAGDGDDVRAVGWLSGKQPYPTRGVPPVFVETLRSHLNSPWQPFTINGLHTCDIGGGLWHRWRREPVREWRNLFVPTRECVYIAPAMVLHYVALQDLVWVEAEEAPQRGLPQPDSLPPLPSRSSARSSS